MCLVKSQQQILHPENVESEQRLILHENINSLYCQMESSIGKYSPTHCGLSNVIMITESGPEYVRNQHFAL